MTIGICIFVFLFLLDWALSDNGMGSKGVTKRHKSEDPDLDI